MITSEYSWIYVTVDTFNYTRMQCILECVEYQVYEFVFADGYESRWVDSEAKGAEQGKFDHTAGKFYNDPEADKGKILFYLSAV